MYEVKVKALVSQSVFKTWLVLTSDMNLQVLPLKVLVSRQVIRDRMDYTDYLAGKTKSEMDILDRLAGRFVVQLTGFQFNTERYIGGNKVTDDEWDNFIVFEIENTLLNFINRALASALGPHSPVLEKTTEINIVETSRSGARAWVISDVDGLKKPFELTSGGYMSDTVEPPRIEPFSAENHAILD